MKHSKDMHEVNCKTCNKKYMKRILCPEFADYDNMECYECYKDAK